jgi:hypothetical protein
VAQEGQAVTHYRDASSNLEDIARNSREGIDRDDIAGYHLQATVAVAQALLAIAGTFAESRKAAICPSQWSPGGNHVCMLPLGHTAKHESPGRKTW